MVPLPDLPRLLFLLRISRRILSERPERAQRRQDRQGDGAAEEAREAEHPPVEGLRGNGKLIKGAGMRIEPMLKYSHHVIIVGVALEGVSGPKA